MLPWPFLCLSALLWFSPLSSTSEAFLQLSSKSFLITFKIFQPETLNKVRIRRFSVWHSLNIFLIFFGVISTSSCSSLYSKSLLKFSSHSASFWCSFLFPQIPYQNFCVSFLSGTSVVLWFFTPLFNSLENLPWWCDLVDTGWFYFDTSLFCCSLP